MPTKDVFHIGRKARIGMYSHKGTVLKEINQPAPLLIHLKNIVANIFTDVMPATQHP